MREAAKARFPSMRQAFRKRWITGLTASLWFSAALLQGIAPALSAFIPAHKTEAEAAAIDLGDSHRQEACHHHPQGCPADCFCPKTGFVGEETSGNPDPFGSGGGAAGVRLHETAWVECSEARAVSTPVFAVYLPESGRGIPVFDISESLVTRAQATVRAVFRAPPAKIPIV